MDSRPIRCRAVALIAAYAVAIQALLSAFMPVVPAVSAAPLEMLCSHDDADGPGLPISHELPCAAVCAALGHGLAGPLPPDVVVARATPYALAALAPAGGWVPPRLAMRGPQAPRGPPLA